MPHTRQSLAGPASRPTRSLLRPAVLIPAGLMLVAAAISSFAVSAGLRDLRTVSQDNILWSATQMEVELLRLQRGIAVFAVSPTPATREELRQRLDILWSRVQLMTSGRVGSLLLKYDEGFGTLARLKAHLETLDPLVLALEPDSVEGVPAMLSDLEAIQQELWLYVLRVVRGETEAASVVPKSTQALVHRLALVGGIAVALGLLALGLAARATPLPPTAAR